MRRASAFFDLDQLPTRLGRARRGTDAFVQLYPAAASAAGRALLRFPDFLSSREIACALPPSRAVRPLGYYQIGNADAGAGNCVLRRRRICCSPSTVPAFWKALLSANPALAPDAQQPARRVITSPAALIASWDYNNYGHFWLDVAPRLYSLWRRRPELLAALSVVVPGDLAAWAQDALVTLFGLQRDAFVRYDAARELVRCRTAIVPTMAHTSHDFHPVAAEFYRHVVDTCTGRPAPGTGRRMLYVTRQRFAQRAGRNVRLLANAAEAEALAAAMGFEIVAPEELGWRDQVALFASAKVVVGEHGSAMKNLLFAPPGTVAVVINALNLTQGQIAAALGHGCLILMADGFDARHPLQPHRVDLAKLRACIESALQASSSAR